MIRDHWQSRCLLKLALLLFLSGQRKITEQSSGKNMLPACSRVLAWSNGTSCACTKSFFYTGYKCHVIGTNATISIVLSSGNRIKLTCHGLGSLDYRLLPSLTEARYSVMHIFHCPLPPGQPIHQINSVLGSSLAHLHELKYKWGGPLERIHLEGLQTLNKLTLSSTDSFNLPEDLFADLRQLISLTIEGNNLMNLTKQAFEGVSSLRELDLSSNGIATFLPDVFSALPQLRNLTLTRNPIQSLPDGLLAINKNLASFQLHENRVQLKQLPGRLLGNLQKLKVVRLSCGLYTIPEDLFVNSKEMWNITITENNIIELPLKLFADQIKLWHLDLSRNQLKSLPDGIFQNTKNLLTLRLSQNRFVTITNRIFHDLNNLRELYIDNNDLSTVHSEAFGHNGRLIHIDMESNKLSESIFHAHDSKFSSLQSLYNLNNLVLRKNSIRRLPDFWTLSNFHAIDLSFNEITEITIEDLDGLYYEIELDLSNNLIQKIYYRNPNTDCTYQHIVLNLSDNPIKCDCELLPFVQFLKSQSEEEKCIEFVKNSADRFQCTYPQNLESRMVTKVSPKELLCPLDRESFAAKLCPEYCTCWARPVDGIAIVNCSSASLTEMPILPNLSLNLHSIHGTELHIENNKLTQLPEANTPGYRHVVALHASNNSLTEVHAISLPKNLTLVDLSRNNIQHLHDTTLSVLNGSRITVALAGNPWICNCASQDLLRFVLLNNKLIRDAEQMKCKDGHKFLDSQSKMICSASQNLVIGACVLITGLFTGIIAGFYYKYQQQIKVWLYARGMCFWFVTEEDLDKDKQYDAFISYSHRDEDFIADYLLPELENGPTPFKLCLHSRDWVVGEFIPDQILRSVEESRRTIIVLSPNFLESNWARMEFRAAHNAALTEGRARVIVILYGDVGGIGSLEPDLKAYLQMNTYVKWGDPWFWKKLRYAMPHPSRRLPGPETFSDNNLELVESSPITSSPAEQASGSSPTIRPTI